MCGKVFERKGSSAQKRLDSHFKVHLEGKTPELKYECSADQCKASFSNKRDHKSHESKCQHVKHTCNQCGGVFASVRSLAAHGQSMCQALQDNAAADHP